MRAKLEEGAVDKKVRKNPSGGLNEKGRKSYERENPGSDLKRPQRKLGTSVERLLCSYEGYEKS